MSRPGSPAFDSEITAEAIRLHDAATHAASMDRRTLLADMARLTGSMAAGAALLGGIEARAAAAPQIATTDGRLETARITWPGANGQKMAGYAAVPRGAAGPLPTVIVVHENRGLTAHIEDVARRMALEGFRALAPDFLTPLGGTPAPAADETAEAASDRARTMIGQLRIEEAVANAVATIAAFAEAGPFPGDARGNGKAGITGFCWGGGMVNRVALAAPPALREAVAWYGPLPPAADVHAIRARLMFHFAGRDERINAGWPPYETALKKAGIAYEAFFYPNAEHAFHNDTSAARYDPEAAALAWKRTVAAFAKLAKA